MRYLLLTLSSLLFFSCTSETSSTSTTLSDTAIADTMVSAPPASLSQSQLQATSAYGLISIKARWSSRHSWDGSFTLAGNTFVHKSMRFRPGHNAFSNDSITVSSSGTDALKVAFGERYHPTDTRITLADFKTDSLISFSMKTKAGKLMRVQLSPKEFTTADQLLQSMQQLSKNDFLSETEAASKTFTEHSVMAAALIRLCLAMAPLLDDFKPEQMGTQGTPAQELMSGLKGSLQACTQESCHWQVQPYGTGCDCREMRK